MLLLALLFSTPALQAESLLPRDRHPWASFQPGAWKKVRVVSETFGADGNVESSSVTETTTTLLEVSDESITLRIEVVVEVAGRRLEAEPQIVSQGLSGEMNGQTTEFLALGEEEVDINGEAFASQVRQVTINGDGTRRVSTVHYSPDVPPFALRRETTATDVATETEEEITSYHTHVEVVALDMPFHVLSEILPTSHVKTVHENSEGNTVTVEVYSADVPGGVVFHTSKKEEGVEISHSTLELVDYGLGEGVTRENRRGRHRRRRAR